MNKRNLIIIFGIIVLATVLSWFAWNNFSLTGSVITDLNYGQIKEITIDAFRFGYSPEEVKVKLGDKIKININNLDTPHGLIIPELNLKGETTIEFTASQKGEFDWYCYTPCGAGHGKMRGKLIIE
ncbi:MAG TPA: cupredoxin domain-containing protein [Candidatus Nanoarchaeia archaeon]|nr:cupredoxin domain-containing protein [Candidatus Nanoarchaeia archaeon]